MTNKDKVNKALENASEDKIKEVLEFLGFLGYKEESKFIPKVGEGYWFINIVGAVDYYPWVNDDFDKYQLSLGNVYRTTEDAEQALDLQTRKAKLIKEIEDSSDVIDWSDDEQYKYRIFLNGRYNLLVLSHSVHIQEQGTTYTTNKQFLKELIKTRADEVKELLFNIKGEIK